MICTKYRRKIFKNGIFAYFNIKLMELEEHCHLTKIKTISHDQDHFHLLISISPTTSVGKIVGLIKQNTARELKQKFTFLKQLY
ncbi:MAG: IS200/IS605 family transposase [Candidatus Shapirobacteria bacterium]|nr:IS200/IS605 family transposase [Candidatus Shapirobacteria bacterium]MDD3002886.1 IS200/IS605 family transposase [Candidatus Shapirobacteria bacterium]MDD4383493.1 IS200/IS605 family transposase [Candidatus Shapirobacteria bacterium]